MTKIGVSSTLSEHIRYLLVFPVVSPDLPDPAARWHLCEHAERAIATVLELVDALEGGLDLLDGEAVGGNLLQVPLDPLEPPHRLNIPRSHRARQSRRVRRAFDDAPIVWRSPDAGDGSRNGASSRT